MTIVNTITFDPRKLGSIKEAEADATARVVMSNCRQAAELLRGVDDVAGSDVYDKQPGFVQTAKPVGIKGSANSITGTILYDTTTSEPTELDATLVMPGLITGRAPLSIKQVDGQRTWRWAQTEVVENTNGTLTVNTYDQGVEF